MRYSFVPGCGHITFIAYVLVSGVINIPSIYTMLDPSYALLRSLIDSGSDARRSHRGRIVVKNAIHMCVGRQVWVLAGRLQHVEGGLTLWKEAAP